MGIRFIYGRAGTGKSTYCLEMISKKVDIQESKKLILLVPEQYTFQSEKSLLNMIGEKGLLKAEVLSFKRMAHRVFEQYGGRAKKLIQNTGKNMLLYKLLQEEGENLKYFNRISKGTGFIDILSEIITEFKKYNITPEILRNIEEKVESEELKEKLSDLEKVFSLFNENMANEKIDGDDELTLLCKKLNENNIYEGAEIWIDEFTTFTPQQMSIIMELSKQCKEVNITLCIDELSMGRSGEITDIFESIKSTENSILRMMEENNISYLKPIDINRNIPYRFRESRELAHIEKHFFTYPFREYKNTVNDIRLYKANNSYDEIETVAKDIVSLVRDKGYRYRDIAVVCRNIKDYEKITTVIFKEYDIPFFLDKKVEVLSNPLIVLILSALDILISNWSYESVFKYLKSGLLQIDRKYIDILENYVLANGIKGYKWTADDIIDINVNSSAEEIALMETIDEIRNPLLKLHKKIRDGSNIRGICTAIYEFLIELDVFNKNDQWISKFENIGLEEKVKEYTQVPKVVIDILDQAVEVIGDENISIYEFYKILIAGFQSKDIGVIPVALDQINIGDIARIKGRKLKAVYIVGVNDGILPSANKDEGILSDLDREVLLSNGVKLASTTKIRAFEEQFMVYSALTIASNYLMITYPMADFEGKSLRPSIVIPRLKRIMPQLIEESDMYNLKDSNDLYNKITAPIPTFNEMVLALRKEFDREETEEFWNEVYSWYKNKDDFDEKSESVFKGIFYNNNEENVPREKLKKLYENEYGRLQFNVSRIEKYAGCPFGYFVQYGLKAKDRKIYEFSAPDMGSFMHDILDSFTNRVKKDGIPWSELNRERCRSIVNELVDIKLREDKNSILNSSKKYKYFTDRFKRVITKSVSVISEQMRKGSFQIFSNEFSFGDFKNSNPISLKLPSGEEVFLTGRIDRIDTLDMDGNSYLKIIDYKSGAKKFDLNELYYGLQMQLLVYLDALIKNSMEILNKQAIPGAILYFKIDDPIIKSENDMNEEQIKIQVLDKLKMNGLLLKDAKLVRAIDNDMETYSLIIPAKFKKDGDFTANSSVVTEEEFNILREYVNFKMIELCEDMLSGNLRIEPCKMPSAAYCEYCDYSSICQFDTSIKDNKYKIVVKRNNDELWNRIKNVVGKGEK